MKKLLLLTLSIFSLSGCVVIEERPSYFNPYVSHNAIYAPTNGIFIRERTVPIYVQPPVRREIIINGHRNHHHHNNQQRKFNDRDGRR